MSRRNNHLLDETRHAGADHDLSDGHGIIRLRPDGRNVICIDTRAPPSPVCTPGRGVVAIVDRRPRERQALAQCLRDFGFAVREGIERAPPPAGRVDLAILVLDPHDDAAVEVRSVVQAFGARVLALDARPDAERCIACLESGADDYLAAQGSPREALVRAKRLAPRVTTPPIAPEPASSEVHQTGPLRIDLTRRRAWVHEVEPIALTAPEFALLAALFRRPQRILTPEQLKQDMGRYTEARSERWLGEVFSALRAKLHSAGARDLLVRHPGRGFSLGCAAGAEPFDG